MRICAACCLGVIVAAGCGGGDDGGPDAAECARPALDPPWLQPYVTEVVTQLAARPRSTVPERDAARAYLMSKLSELGWTPELHTYATGANVLATIPATTGDAAGVIVGAHFDSVAGGPGANDNASGVAVVLSVARTLADTPCRAAPVTVVLFDQEESNLLGSRAFARTLVTADVRAVHTIDQVAWDADNDRRFELEIPTPTLEAEWRAAATIVGASLMVTSTSGTDHQSFREVGLPAVGLTEEYVGGDTTPHFHRATDTPASIVPHVAYLVLAAQLTTQVVLEEVAGASL